MNNDLSNQKIFLFVIITSLIVSVLGGGVGGYAVWQWQESRPIIINNNEAGERYEPSIDEELATVKAVESVTSSVVSIVVTKEIAKFSNLTGPDIFPFGDFFEFGFPEINMPEPESKKQEVGSGTGFIMSADGLIVTNKHVVIDDEAEYSVILNDNQKFSAKVLAKDPFNDLAVIKIEANNLPIVTLGDSDAIRIGQSVIAIGNTLGEYSNTVTKGVISGINRRVVAGDGFGTSEVIEEAIQTDAAINPGNSGGPLINLNGEVIGVNTAISRAGQLVGFAIPINTAKNMIASVKEFGRIVRPWLGVRYVLNNETLAAANGLSYDYGALILPGRTQEELAIVPGSPADKAGLEANDIILEINGNRIEENNSLGRAISKFKPGDAITLKVFHDGEEKNITATLGEFKNE